MPITQMDRATQESTAQCTAMNRFCQALSHADPSGQLQRLARSFDEATPNHENEATDQSRVTRVLQHPTHPFFRDRAFLDRRFFSKILSDSNFFGSPDCWYGDQQIDALAYLMQTASAGRLLYVNGPDLSLHAYRTTPVSSWVLDSIESVSKALVEVVFTILNIGGGGHLGSGNHWAIVWVRRGEPAVRFAEGLDYNIEPSFYAFSRFIEEHMGSAWIGTHPLMLDDSTRVYVGHQVDIHQPSNTHNMINCGVIAIRVLGGLLDRRVETDMQTTQQHMALDADGRISQVECQLWRTQHATCLLDWHSMQHAASTAALLAAGAGTAVV